MARISDKFYQSKLISLRRKLDFNNEELKTLDTKYDEVIEKKLNAFLNKANKKLSGSAFDACDKEEYALAIFNEKLQKYDVKAYMSHRAVNHGAAKSIFKAVKNGEPIEPILEKRAAQMEKVSAKRAKRVAELDKQRLSFIDKARTSDTKAYEQERATLEAAYLDEEKKLGEAYQAKISKERAGIESKNAKLEDQIAKIKASHTSTHYLPDDVILSVSGLKMYFGGLRAVDDLTFDVRRGEIFGLIGPNGAGKTTVFNCITCFYNATGGDMYFENKYGDVVDLRSFKVHDIILQGIGRTFQNIELVKEISVIENLLVASTRSYNTGLLGHFLAFPSLRKEERVLRKKAMNILKFMDLESYANWYAMGLPYGILKKVEIARALMADAKLIIMDEPAAGLNDSETAELTETIRKIRDEFGVTILLVEHDMGLVMNVCDTVCAISFGQMLAIGTPEEIQKNKAVQEAYLGVEEDE